MRHINHTKPITHMKKILNWSPVVESFAKAIVAGGFEIKGALDGESAMKENPTAHEAAEWVCSCDEGGIKFTKDGNRVTALIVLGNDPDEIVADWRYNNDETEKEFDKLWSTWMETWVDKECPTKMI